MHIELPATRPPTGSYDDPDDPDDPTEQAEQAEQATKGFQSRRGLPRTGRTDTVTRRFGRCG